MKKIFLTAGIILLAAALICLALGLWFRHLGGSIMDGPPSVYARSYRLWNAFLRIAAVSGAVGAALTAAGLLMKTGG